MTIRSGSKRFELAVDEFEKRVIKEIKRIVKETAEMIVTNAKALAPVDDGSLRDSIDVVYTKGGLTAIISVGVSYGIYVEFGTGIYAIKGNGRKDPWVYFSKKLNRWVYTRGMTAQPFFFPALDIAEKHWRSELKKLG
ncbi:HK97-gp10 family putative phage morphogenesis protein [Rossellomorea sp. BNER]|uniref:HK97-gp10 family putative phage morphogenesis protein n=1 Tax=Rossellomorea sp. BNER TaxID=2962031 RepID=UPI003AF225BE|nr:HK97 gp10 family phage protein [Rossellomorea sp. BNER]